MLTNIFYFRMSCLLVKSNLFTLLTTMSLAKPHWYVLLSKQATAILPATK